MDCRLVREHLDAYVHAELEPTPVIEFERHLDVCSGCRNELALARLIRQGVRTHVQPVSAPRSVKLGVLAALDEADAPSRRHHLRHYGALAAAAVVALGVGGLFNGAPASPGVPTTLDATAAPAKGAPVQLLRDIVAQHTDELPTEIAPERPEEVTHWFRNKVRFRVRSLEFTEPRVRMEGARVSYIANQPAAKLYYRVGNSRVTVVAFPADASRSLHSALHDASAARRLRLHRTRVGDRVAIYDNVQNYTVPVIEHNGIVYGFTGDLDQASLLRLVSSARLR